MLSEFYAHYQKHQEIDSFDPQKVENFLKNLPYKTPFLEGFFEDSLSKPVTILSDIPDFKGILSAGMLENYKKQFESLIYEKTIKSNHEEHCKARYTPEARKAVEKRTPIDRLIILLGGREFIIAVKNFYDPFSEWEALQTAADAYKKSEAPIDTFLYYLDCTRLLSSPSPAKKHQRLEIPLIAPGSPLEENPSRMAALKEKLSQ